MEEERNRRALSTNFVATTPLFTEEVNLFPQTVMYWITGNNGKSKKYTEATAKETMDWAAEILPKALPKDVVMLLMGFDEENLSLATNRAFYVNLVLQVIQESKISSLFGKREEWDKIEEWVRLQKAEGKARKKNIDKK